MADKDPQSSEQKLASYLRSQGLDDAEFWLSEFEKKGVKSMKSISFLEGEEEEFSELEKVARNKVEIKALKKLLKIEQENEGKAGKCKKEEEKDVKKLEEARKEADKLMKELDKARKDGKDRHDSIVTKTEANIRERLQISPKSWISDDSSLEDLIDKLNSHLVISGKLRQREWYSESMLLQNASGGRALQGVYLTKRLEDQLEVRDRLLEVPKDVLITGPALSSPDTVEQFSSTDQENEYTKTVEAFGRSISANTKIGYGGCTVGMGVSHSERKEDEKLHQENRKEMYSSTIKLSTLHVASYKFESSDLKLSKDAIKYLKEISIMLGVQKADSFNVQEACKRFFCMFGSHANRGPLSFGGHFMLKCYSKGFQSSEIDSVKELQTNAVTVTAGFSFPSLGISTEVSKETVKGKYSGSSSKKTHGSTVLEVNTEGGPSEAADLELWKSGLVANNSTWILTDRGQKLEAVWDIIRKNHQRELGSIRDVLRSSWEKITGLNAEQDLMFTLSFNPESILDEVSQLNEHKLTPHQIESTLDRLVKVREDIVIKTANPSIWINEYLSKRVIQEFFESIVDAEEEPSEHVKFLMQQLFVKKELKQVGIQHLPSIDKISDWLYKPIKKPNHYNLESIIVDLQSFEKFLKETLNEVKLAQLDAPQERDSKVANPKITTQVTQAFLCIQSLYKGKYESVFVTILMSPLQYQGRDRVRPLTLKDLERLHKSLSEERIMFNQHVHKNILLNLQIYLVQLLIKICSGQLLISLLSQVRDMMSNLNLDESLLKETNTFIHGQTSLVSYKKRLNSLISTPSPLPAKVGVHSLRSVLETKAYNSAVSKSDHTLVFNSNKKAFDLFKKFDLCQYYPMGLQLKDALCVRSGPLELSLNQNNLTSPQEIPYLVLHKLMAYDHRCRSDLMAKTTHYDDDANDDNNDDDDNDDDEDDDEDTFEDEHETIHPVDSLLALLICSDNFLRQDLLSRLAKCQLAIPFILPDPFTQQLTLPLWAMRSIIKDWKCVEGPEVVEKTSPIINYGMPIISFIRFGKQLKRGVSKSKLLNDVISDEESHHNYFFHRDCAGGQSEVLLGKGLIDMCWYLSSGKPIDSEAFSDAVTFLNLHGDAREYPRQSRFLSKISFMCFILLSEEDITFEAETIEILNDFASSPGGITILNDTEKPPTKLKSVITPNSKVSSIKLTDKNASKIKTSVQNRIKKRIQGINRSKLKSLEECCINTSVAIIDSEILIDEGSGSFKEGMDLANEVKRIVTSNMAKSSSAKEELLPLHGSLWQAWASKDKELYRQVSRGSKTVNEYTDEIKAQKRALRQAQLKHVESLTPVMETFIASLLKLGGTSNRIVRNYFLQCLKLGLNDFSRERISRLQQQYQSARIKLGEIKEETDIREGGKAATKEQITLMNKLKKDMDGLQKQIIQASFGLEHLLRELGQIYEAAAQPSQIPSLSRLPEAAAELLIEGYPLELMDGDAAHVPLRWVSTVITEVANKLENPNVFVLSVLGLQSTGKSTMLNTAFGLQFNVSSGRCTRGAFMQLLPLDEQIKKTTDFSYVLIVDTEGLRAPELDSLQTQKHDNELATFVIGLANMTLINIYGEVPGDMDDILQTSVHAFLRMSQVIKYRKSCQFVHQNAGSGKNTEVGRANFTKKLNKFTVDAAKEEHVEGEYETFNDVIKFNDLKDVHNFPGLLKGDPPMAPLNQGYSDAAQKLKRHFIENLNESRVGNLPISSFKDKVDDLWKALLKENFVFSFKNTLEITAYNSLETQYSQWEWKFRAAMMKWEREEENVITTADLSTVSQLVQSKCIELEKQVHKLCSKYKSEMDKFFSDSKQGDTLVQWKARFETKLTTLRDELKTHAESHCKKLGVGREAISKFEKERKQYTELMTESVQELLVSLKQEQEQLHVNLKKGKLELSQLRKILTLDLFNPDSLEQYTKQGLITGAQQESIRDLVCVSDCSSSSLTEENLRHILIGGILSTEQVIVILKQGQQSERELEIKFNSDWEVMLGKLPYVPEEKINVEALVESTLLYFVKSYDGQLLDELRKTSLKKRGASLRLAVEEKKHYKTTEKSSWLGKQATKVYTFFGGIISDPHQMEAQKITDEVLEEARSKIKSTADLETDFNSSFTLELLRELDIEINKRASKYTKNFTFTQKYKLDVYQSACGYAVVEFEDMAETFWKKNDPCIYLETEVKGPLFSRFKNQYYQKKVEEGIANTLCAHFAGRIKTQVRKSLGSTIVEQMKNSEHHFKSKMALKVKILTDLYEEDNFNSYMAYVTNVKRCLEERLKWYTIEYCDYTVSKNTRLQNLAKEEVSRVIQFVENQVTEYEASEENFSTWLEAFCNNVEIRRELGLKLNASDIIDEYDSTSIQKLNLENVKRQIRQGLTKLRENLRASFNKIKCKNEMESWMDKPHELLKKLVGCTEQCPFCGEQCDLQDPEHAVNHRVGVHRSSCLAGYKNVDTKVMDTEFCPAQISGKLSFRNTDTNHDWVKFIDFQKIYPKWTITPDVTSGDSLYWMLFIGKYKDEIANFYKAKPPNIPKHWSTIPWDEVEASLKKLYCL